MSSLYPVNVPYFTMAVLLAASSLPSLSLLPELTWQEEERASDERLRRGSLQVAPSQVLEHDVIRLDRRAPVSVISSASSSVLQEERMSMPNSGCPTGRS